MFSILLSHFVGYKQKLPETNKTIQKRGITRQTQRLFKIPKFLEQIEVT